MPQKYKINIVLSKVHTTFFEHEPCLCLRVCRLLLMPHNYQLNIVENEKEIISRSLKLAIIIRSTFFEINPSIINVMEEIFFKTNKI